MSVEEYLAGVEDVVGVECLLDASHHLQRLLRIMLQQILLLAHADAMLTSACAAGSNGPGDHSGVGLLGTLHLLRVGEVQGDQQVEVAIASMSDQGCLDAKLGKVLLRLFDHVGKPAKWDTHVSAPELLPRPLAAQTPVHALPRRPQLLALAILLHAKHKPTPAEPTRHLLCGFDALLYLVGRAGELEEDGRLDLQPAVLVIVEQLGGVRGQQLHTSHRYPCLDETADTLARILDSWEATHRHALVCWTSGELQRRLGHDAECPLTADKQPREVVPSTVLPRPCTRLDDPPIRQHHRKLQHPILHRPVANCVGAAASGADHPTDASSWTRVDREEEAGVCE
mmetsp:Transcript_25626/g.63582  ORF Transcript_25626/g.63582 Transcript_25626/m.63582 type:complete len:341 (-) Transcript_25626:842-1864(-)